MENLQETWKLMWKSSNNFREKNEIQQMIEKNIFQEICWMITEKKKKITKFDKGFFEILSGNLHVIYCLEPWYTIGVSFRYQ